MIGWPLSGAIRKDTCLPTQHRHPKTSHHRLGPPTDTGPGPTARQCSFHSLRSEGYFGLVSFFVALADILPQVVT